MFSLLLQWERQTLQSRIFTLHADLCLYPKHTHNRKQGYLQCSPLILAPLVNISKGDCENKSALFILFIFHLNKAQHSNLLLK